MKTRISLIIVLGVVLLMGFQGCATPICTNCPSQDVIIIGDSPFGPMPIRLKKGHFDNPDSYYTIEEWEEVMKEIENPKQGL